MRQLHEVILVIFVAVASTTMACPGFVTMKQLGLSHLIDRQDGLRLFSLSREGWRWLHYQIQDYDDAGSLVFSDDDRVSSRLLMLDVSGFGRRYDGENLPCGATSVSEIQAGRGFAYFLRCANPPKGPLPLGVKYHPKEQTVDTMQYRFVYSRDHPLLFEDLILKDSDGSQRPFAVDSHIEVYADLGWIDFTFGPNDFISRIDRYHQGPLALTGRLQFSLKILFFEVELNLRPEAHFFTKSVYLPMVFHLPIDAAGVAKLGSGVTYSWQSDRQIRWSWQGGLPPYGSSSSLAAKELLRYCLGKICRFWMKGSRPDGTGIRFTFNIPRALVEKGFFPRFMADSDFTKVEQTSNAEQDRNQRLGLFFASDQLTKGSHHWAFWVTPLAGSSAFCPRSVRVVRPIVPVTSWSGGRQP